MVNSIILKERFEEYYEKELWYTAYGEAQKAFKEYEKEISSLKQQLEVRIKSDLSYKRSYANQVKINKSLSNQLSQAIPKEKIKEIDKEQDGLYIFIITSTLANGIIYIMLEENIFASYLTLIPLCLGYFVYCLYTFDFTSPNRNKTK